MSVKINGEDMQQYIHRAQQTIIIVCKDAKFSLGAVVATPGALALLQKHGFMTAQLLTRHLTGDWGDCYREDAMLNEAALKDGSRLFSVYRLANEDAIKQTSREKRNHLPTVWVITEALNEDGNRATTTLLLPEDY